MYRVVPEQLRVTISCVYVQVVDARSSARFNGEVAEPRPSLASGAMKGAVNLHYSRLLDPEKGTFKPKAELAKGRIGVSLCLYSW